MRGGDVFRFLLRSPLVGVCALDPKPSLPSSSPGFSHLVGGLAHLRAAGARRIAIHAGIYSRGRLPRIASQLTSDPFLLVCSHRRAMVAAIMFLPAPSKAQEEVSTESVLVSMPPLFFFSLMTGVVIGFLGAGNFVFVPLLIYVLKVPTRIAIGSSLFIAMMNTAAGFAAKFLTGEDSVAGAQRRCYRRAIGALAGEQTPQPAFYPDAALYLATMIGVIAIRIWLPILGSGA